MNISYILKLFYLLNIKRIKTPKDIILYAVKKHGGKFILKENDILYTLNEINNRVNQLSHSLLKFGINKGDKIGVLLHNSKEYIEIRLAAYKCGFVFCALLDDFTIDQSIEVLNDTKCKILIYDGRLNKSDCNKISKRCSLKIFISTSKENLNDISVYYDDLIYGACINEPKISINNNEISAIGYTSGTTGKSKGVVWKHKAWFYSLIHFYLNAKINCKDMCTLHYLPFSTSGSLFILPWMVSGSRITLLQRFDCEQISETIEKEKINNILFAPSHLIELWEYYTTHPHKYNYSTLTQINVGSAPLPASKWKAISNTLGVRIIQSYGMAEVLAPIASLDLSGKVYKSELYYSVGKPIRQIKIKIIEKDKSGKGIICLKSKSSALNYFINNKFYRNRFKKGWFISEDIGFINNDGFLFVIDRISNIIRKNNLIIYPRDIEEIIHEVPEIKEVCVLFKDNMILAFYSKIKNALFVDLENLKYLIESSLDKNHVPEKFIEIDDFAHSTSGKILKRELFTSINQK